MEESAEQQEKTEGSREGRRDGGKDTWKNECSLSSLLKHSCLLCWSSPRDMDVAETDERVLAKAAEIRELENALTMENLELQEQQSDRKELEETLVKLDKHKDKLIQQIKTTRKLCCEESQQILSLQAEEVQKESQVEEYERELARARWRLRRLREEVKQAKRKVEEAGERNTPLQDSIKQSYEEILQEEHTLCSLSGGAVTPESQMEGSTSPADTTEDDPLPVRPWGRSQSLPAYADLIMRASSINLADAREADNSESSSPKSNRSNMEEPRGRNISQEGDAARGTQGCTVNPDPLTHLDFYQSDPFSHCHSEHDLFREDLFPNTDLSDGFTSDPFKGSNPFSADIFFAEVNTGPGSGAAIVHDEADTSLSCAENKASTGTQCFESEFPDDDSDIEVSYSCEDLGAMAMAEDAVGFKPIQSSSEELGPEPVQGWMSQGQYSVESDPNGYELDLGAVSPPSDIEEQSVGSLAGPEEGLTSVSAQMIPELEKQVLLEKDWTCDTDQTPSNVVSSSQAEEWTDNINEGPQIPAVPQNLLDFQNRAEQNKKLSFEMNYESSSPSSFDPYGFKLSPEHASHMLLDPDESVLSPEPTENNPFEFNMISSQSMRRSDPYGFKLSPEEENQEVLEYSGQDHQKTLDLCTYDNNEQVEPCNYRNQEILEPQNNENKEIIKYCSANQEEPLDLYDTGNRELLECSRLDTRELVSSENQELLHFSQDSLEVVKPCPIISGEEILQPCRCGNQETLGSCSHSHWELLDFSSPENQEVLDFDSNQELLEFSRKENQDMIVSGSHDNQKRVLFGGNENQELLELESHGNQEVLDLLNKKVFPEANNNKCTMEPQLSVNNSSDSEVSSEDLLVLELSSSICSTSTTNISNAISNMSAVQTLDTANAPTRHNLLEGDLGSVFGAGGYIGCPDVTDDLESLDQMQATSVPEQVKPMRPVRPPRPSLRAKEEAQSQAQGIDLK